MDIIGKKAIDMRRRSTDYLYAEESIECQHKKIALGTGVACLGIISVVFSGVLNSVGRLLGGRML